MNLLLFSALAWNLSLLAYGICGADFYVSLSGEDAPNRQKNTPLASLKNAEEEVRNFRLKNQTEPMTVWRDKGRSFAKIWPKGS